MNIKVLLAYCIAIVGFPVIAVAQRNDMNYFAGDWSFQVWFAPHSSGKPGISATWHLHAAPDSATCLDGFVLLNDNTRYTNEHIRYDASRKVYTRSITTNDANHFEFSTRGWVGAKLTWTGTQTTTGKTILLKEKITRTNSDEFTASFYTRRANKWIKTQTEVLKRIIPPIY